jgi:glycine oxidase
MGHYRGFSITNVMTAHPDVLIIGAGVIGLTTAHYLAESGLRATVLDRADLGREASWAGAGIIPPGAPEHARTPIDQLRAISSALYPTLSAELRAATGVDNGYSVCGGLELIETEADLVSDEWRSDGVVFEELDAAELHRREPALASHFQRAFYLPHIAQVRNPRHLQALIASCQRQGVELAPHCAVRGFVRSGERIAAVETSSGRRTAGQYLLTAGAWSDGLLEQVGWKPGIRPIRGQIALLNTGQSGVRPLILAGKRYLVPRGDGRILIGSTEEEAGFDARPTAGGIAGLLQLAAALMPSLGSAPLERCWAGLRPGSADGLPYLGRVPGLDNLYVGAGHFRAGLQLSPATGQILRDLICRAPTNLMSLEPFRLDRPAVSQTAFRS